MNGKDLLVGLGCVDEEFVEEAEMKKKTNKGNSFQFLLRIKDNAAIAAGVVLMILTLSLYQSGWIAWPAIPSLDAWAPGAGDMGNDDRDEKDYKLYLNDAQTVSANRVMVEGYFGNDLTAQQMEGILPLVALKHELAGVAHYGYEDEAASLYEIAVSVEFDESIRGIIRISPDEVIQDYIIAGSPIASSIEGIPIEAGVLITDRNSEGKQNYIYYANFEMDQVAYDVELVSVNEEAEDVFTSLVADVILGGKAELSVFDHPDIPQTLDKVLTESEAYGDSDFGKYLIEVPKTYVFNGAKSLQEDVLIASWSKAYADVTVRVSKLDKDSQARMVSPEDTELYDMSRYPVPWVDSMPREYSHIIENPVFRIEELSLNMIRMRGYTREEAGDTQAQTINMRFAVLYENTIVEVNAEGLGAEYLFQELTSLPAK